jgi:hypothetical protein
LIPHGMSRRPVKCPLRAAFVVFFLSRFSGP